MLTTIVTLPGSFLSLPFSTSFFFSRGLATLEEALSVRPLVGRSVGWSVGRSVVIESESGKTRISAPAPPSATGTGRVSGLVFFRVDTI